MFFTLYTALGWMVLRFSGKIRKKNENFSQKVIISL
jgi:hypothetical protein